MSDPTPRQRFIATLERRPLSGRVPHFELVFYLTMVAFGRVHPPHRDYSQWLQMEEKEHQLPMHGLLHQQGPIPESCNVDGFQLEH